MTDAALLIAAWLCAYAGGATVALASRSHWKAATGSDIAAGVARRLRSRGWVLLSVCVGLAVWRDGWGLGLLLGPLLIVVGLAAAVATLTVRPGLLAIFARP